MQQIFLEKNRSVFSNNVESSIDVGLSTKTRLLPNTDLADSISLYEQYNTERNECNKYRIIVDINPLCSNVLFNMKSEILIDEGGEDCLSIIDNGTSVSREEYASNAGNSNDIDYLQAIRDTEYSHKNIGNFVYHCGIDIFNNHMLRKNNFVHVNPTGSPSAEYNTILDYSRNNKGEIIKEEIGHKYTDTEMRPIHLYQYDSILSMKEAFLERCKEVDGWWGFYNPNNINIANFNGNNSNNSINKMMANNKACEFIDLYPDRSLYSFIPKKNKRRNRLENNWDYCLTYPFSADTKIINTIFGNNNGALRGNVKITYNPSGIKMIECYSLIKHNLTVGDSVKLFFSNTSKNVEVISIGDANGENTDRIFSIRAKDLKNSVVEDILENGMLFKKVINGVDCEYYVRLLKKLTNNGDEIKSDINKIAFGQNIYGDRTAQIIFTDDIDLDGLTDNLGRPISEIFFTTVKRNAGHDLWYNEDNFNDENIEFSHCFGKITSGIDMGNNENTPKDYNVRRMHNVKLTSASNNDIPANTIKAWGTSLSGDLPKTIEDDITIDNDIFYGDLIEFDPTNFIETSIDNIYHRFNTAQRESTNQCYRDIYQDVITNDDYDVNVDGNGNKKPFEVKTYLLNDMKTTRTEKGTAGSLVFYGNISPEGYYYQPHHRIILKEFDDEMTEADAKYINYSEFSIKNNGTYKTLIIKAPTNYKFLKGDNIAFYHINKGNLLWMEISKVDDSYIELVTDDMTLTEDMFLPNNENRVYYAFWTSSSVPNYAYLLFNKRKFVWRKITLPSNLDKNSDIYDMPFSNGRFYNHKCINFFLKRQDPYGTFGLANPKYKNEFGVNSMAQYTIEGYQPIDFTKVISQTNISNICY